MPDRVERPRSGIRPGRVLIGIALLIVIPFLVLHALGYREYSGVVSGTDVPRRIDSVKGLAYVVCYLGTVVVAPLLAIAGVTVTILHRLLGRRGRVPDGHDAVH